MLARSKFVQRLEALNTALEISAENRFMVYGNKAYQRSLYVVTAIKYAARVNVLVVPYSENQPKSRKGFYRNRGFTAKSQKDVIAYTCGTEI